MANIHSHIAVPRRCYGGRIAVLLGLTLVLLVAAGAKANPDLRSKREQAGLILAQVQELDAEVGAAAERWNGAKLELSRLDHGLRSAQIDLQKARQTLRSARVRVADRLVQLYVSNGSTPTIEVVVAAKSLRELIDVLDAQQRIAEQDAQIVERVTTYRGRVELRKRRIVSARSRQQTVVEQLAAERAAIEAKLAERSRLLGTVQTEVRRLEAKERERQAVLRRQAVAELARQRREAARVRAAGQARAAESRRADQQAAAAREPIASTESSALNIPDTAAEPPASTIPETPTETREPATETTETPTETAATATLTLGTETPPPASGRGADVVAISMRYLGIPYKWGGASPSTGFDCSGFTMYVFAEIGVSLPHYAAAQCGMGVAVEREQLEPGDLVFFRGLGHMGMYIGGSNFIHSPRTGDVVKISSLSEAYYTANWVGARRVL